MAGKKPDSCGGDAGARARHR